MHAKKLSAILIFASLCLFTAWYLSRHPESFNSLKYLTVTDVFYLITLRILFLIINGRTLKIFVSRFQIVLTCKEWVSLAFVTALGNYLAPFSGGMLMRAGYLKHNHNLPLTQFTLLLASSYLIVFFCVSIAGLLASFILLAQLETLPWQFPAFFTCVILSLITLVLIPVPNFSSKYWLTRKLQETLTGWQTLKKDKKLIISLSLYTFLNIIINGTSFFIAYKAIGYDIEYFHALIISLIAVFSLLVNITPANLGLQEAVVSVTSMLLGQGSGEGLIVALIVRTSTMLPVFILGPFFVNMLMKNLQGNAEKTPLG